MTFKVRINDRVADTRITITDVTSFEQLWEGGVLVQHSDGTQELYDDAEIWDAGVA